MTVLVKSKTPKRLSHDKRAQRRTEILERLKAGDAPEEVAVAFDLTPHYVKALVRQDQGLAPGRAMRLNTYKLIASMCKTRKPITRLARRFKQNPKVVQEVYRKCREAGIPVKERKLGRPRNPEQETKT